MLGIQTHTKIFTITHKTYCDNNLTKVNCDRYCFNTMVNGIMWSPNVTSIEFVDLLNHLSIEHIDHIDLPYSIMRRA